MNKKLRDDKNKIKLHQFRVELLLSVFLLIFSYFIPNYPLRNGMMLGAVINVFYNSIISWYMLKEGEKFSISFISLTIVVLFTISKF